MKRIHYTDGYLLNPQHPITISLIGAGGTGSQVLTCLARLDVTLRNLGHPGLFITLYDPDDVSEANIGPVFVMRYPKSQLTQFDTMLTSSVCSSSIRNITLDGFVCPCFV